MTAALQPLQAQGIKILPYLDDLLICVPSQSQAVQDTTHPLFHVARLGLTLPFKKSCLVPFHRITFLGVVLDMVPVRAYLSPQGTDNILRLLPLFKKGRFLTYLQLLCLLGKLTATSAVIILGLLSLRPLQMWLNSLCLDARRHKHRKVRVSH